MQSQLVFGACCASLGVLVLIKTLRELAFASASRRWPPVPGWIRAVDIEHDTNDDCYNVSVAYSYVVDGQDLPASNVRFGAQNSFSTKAAAEQYLAQFQPGQAHAIYVDPAVPTRSVLVPGLSFWAWACPLGALLLIWTGAAQMLGLPP